MSLRYWFAGQALAGIMASDLWRDHEDVAQIAKLAVESADAVLEALDK